MSKKIAVLVNEDTMQRCSCGGCLKAFRWRSCQENRVFQEKRCYYGTSFYVYAW